MNYEYETHKCAYPECNNTYTTFVEMETAMYPSCDRHAERLPSGRESAFRIYWKKWKAFIESTDRIADDCYRED